MFIAEVTVAKTYPVLYTILVWVGVAVFGFVTFYGTYILSLVDDFPTEAERQIVIEAGAAIMALGTTSLIFLAKSLWRNRDTATRSSQNSPRRPPIL